MSFPLECACCDDGKIMMNSLAEVGGFKLSLGREFILDCYSVCSRLTSDDYTADDLMTKDELTTEMD